MYFYVITLISFHMKGVSGVEVIYTFTFGRGYTTGLNHKVSVSTRSKLFASGDLEVEVTVSLCHCPGRLMQLRSEVRLRPVGHTNSISTMLSFVLRVSYPSPSRQRAREMCSDALSGFTFLTL